MRATDEMLTAFEQCPRKAFWMRRWKRLKLDSVEMLEAGVRTGLLETRRKDWGELAGETVYGLGVEPGLETTHYAVHDEVIHLAALADVVTTALRKDEPWTAPEPTQILNEITWTPGVLMNAAGDRLRRIVFASSWSDDRHYSLCRSWQSLGNVCACNLPMQMGVVLLGQHRKGKYHSSWTRGLRHPKNRQLRFRKKHNLADDFKETWLEVWREDFDDIATHDWLEAMLKDGVLSEVCFKVDIAVPEKPARQRILDLAARKLDRMTAMKDLPDMQLSGCDWPIPCVFRGPCHRNLEPSTKSGFVRIGD
jgi:hypothetical protein